ncbi:TolC family protein [Chromatiaceae bacterium AAb-1]|nr:TolC family protein [Chromatiaceae bacterium AAb-1]
MRMKFYLLWLPAIVLTAALPAKATGQTLSLSQALQRAMLEHPELQLYPYQLRMAEADYIQASLAPNPQLDISLENVLGSGESKGFDSAELTLSLNQVLELGEKRHYRQNAAQIQQQLAGDEYELTRLEVITRTTRRYLDVLRLQALNHWLDERIRREQDALAIAQKRAAAGAVNAADVSRLALQLFRSQLLQQSRRAELQTALWQLAANWNKQPDFQTVQGDLADIAVLPPLADVLVALQQAPAFTRLLTIERLKDSEQQLAVAGGRSDITVGAGIRRNEISGDTGLVFSFSVPLALRNPNSGIIQSSAAARDMTRLQQQQTETALRLAVLALYQQTDSQQQNLVLLNQQLKPQAEKLLQQTLKGYQSGHFDIQALLAAQQELLQAELDIIETQVAIHLQLLEMTRLTGQPVTATADIQGVRTENYP